MKNFSIQKCAIVLIACAAGMIHYAVAVTLYFHGEVINPNMIHQTYSVISLVLLLPFSLLLPFFVWVPFLSDLSPIFGLMSLIFWIVIYYKFLKKYVSKYCSGTAA